MPLEFRFTQKAGLPSDIWMLACAIFEIRACYSLFDSSLRNSDIVLMQIVETLRQRPDPRGDSLKSVIFGSIRWRTKAGGSEPGGTHLSFRKVHAREDRADLARAGAHRGVSITSPSRKMALSSEEVNFLTNLLGRRFDTAQRSESQSRK